MNYRRQKNPALARTRSAFEMKLLGTKLIIHVLCSLDESSFSDATFFDGKPNKPSTG
jgi:hypothetical protein